MAITCNTVNDLFQRETGRFSVDIQERYQLESPWGRLTRVGKFPLGMGTSLTETTVERVLSGSFETDWADVSTGTSGSVSNGCVPSPTDLQFGQSTTTWNLTTKAYQTPCICLDDLKTSFEVERQVAKTVQQLTQLTRTVLDNRRRTEYMRIVPRVSSGDFNEYTGTTLGNTLAATINGTASTLVGANIPTNETLVSGGVNLQKLSINYAQNGFPLPQPTSQLSQDYLDVLRVQLIRDGAGHNPLGRENGAAVLGLITSAETSRQLLRNNQELRQDLRWATPSELVAPLGVDRSYGGYYHLVDFEVPRFTYVPATTGSNATPGYFIPVYPYKQGSASKGQKWSINSAYNTAPYEAAYVFHPDVYEEAVQQVGPNIPGAPFDDFPYYYSGQFFWLNIRSEANPLGKIGRWMALFNNGTRPLQPWLGRAIIHKRCPLDLVNTVACNSTLAGNS